MGSNFKLVIISFTNKPEACEEWIDFVIPARYENRVEFYIDSNREVYKKLGFDWIFLMSNLRNPPPFMTAFATWTELWPIQMVKKNIQFLKIAMRMTNLKLPTMKIMFSESLSMVTILYSKVVMQFLIKNGSW